MLTADELYETVVKQLEYGERMRLMDRIKRDLSNVDAAVAAGLLKRPLIDLPLEPVPHLAEVIGPDSVLDQISRDRE